MKLHEVIESLQSLASEDLAESWDRVGLHVGMAGQNVGRAMLCIDLTEPVIEEAIRKEVDLVVAYHPPIFKPLPGLTDLEPKQRIALRAAQAGIAVYSPHTALDAASGGVNDWLASGFGAGQVRPIRPAEGEDEAAGQGRVLLLDRAVRASTLSERMKSHLGMGHLELASAGRRPIRRVGLCAGAGGSLIEEAGQIDLFFTGEMRHHDVLEAVSRGVSILLAGHTQTERPYLPVYRKRLAGTPAGRSVRWSISSADRAPTRLV